MGWRELLLDTLCRIYKEWGGDCADFDWECPKAIQVVIGAFEEHGVGGFTYQQKQNCLALMDELEGLLEDPGNDLPPEENEMLEDFIADMRAALT